MHFDKKKFGRIDSLYRYRENKVHAALVIRAGYVPQKCREYQVQK